MNKMLKIMASAALMLGATGAYAQETATPDVKSYDGYLNISMLGTPVAINQKSNIQITQTGETTCNFLLPDLTLADMGLSLGAIALNDVTIETDFYGNQTYSKEKSPMGLLDGAIKATVGLNGTISNMGEVKMDIPVIWDASDMDAGEIPIDVTFSTKPAGTEYSGYLNISLAGTPVATNSKASVYIVDTADNECIFLLPNLALPELELSLGDISLTGVTVASNGGTTTYTKAATEMALLDGAINAKVSLDGSIDADGLANMSIPVIWVMDAENEIPIEVTFSTKPVGTEIAGYLTIGFEGADPMETDKPAMVYITETGEGECNFLLPDLSILDGFMNIGDVALSGVKVATANGVTTYTHAGTPMNIYLQGQELNATVKMNGTIDANGVVNMMIPVIWHIPADPDSDTEAQDMPINVKFSTEKSAGITAAGADNSAVVYGIEGAVKVAGVEGTVSVYTTTGIKVAEAEVNGEATLNAPKGIAIVATPAGTSKVVVK